MSVANAYCFNSTLSGVTLGSLDGPTTSPSDKVMTMDGNTTTADTTIVNPVNNVAYWKTDYAYRHNNGLIASYCDGHVALVKNPLTGVFGNRLTPLASVNFNPDGGYSRIWNDRNPVSWSISDVVAPAPQGTSKALVIPGTLAGSSLMYMEWSVGSALANRLRQVYNSPLGSPVATFVLSYKLKRISPDTAWGGIAIDLEYVAEGTLGWEFPTLVPSIQPKWVPAYVNSVGAAAPWATIDETVVGANKFTVIPAAKGYGGFTLRFTMSVGDTNESFAVDDIMISELVEE